MQSTNNTISEAVKHLKKGGVIAYPTEAVYGFGCDPFNIDAVTKILQIKHRDISKGFILIAADLDQIETLIEPLETGALARVLATWPGPTTWVFPATPQVPKWVRGKHKTIAVRVSDHPTVQALCKSFGGPIISTSANIKGTPPARDYRTVKLNFGKQLDYIVQGKVGKQTQPTIIKDAITGEILRSN